MRTTLSTGREINDFRLSVTPEMELFEGYDCGFWSHDWGDDHEPPLTPAELCEIADIQILRWHEFRAHVKAWAIETAREGCSSERGEGCAHRNKPLDPVPPAGRLPAAADPYPASRPQSRGLVPKR